MVQGGGGNTSKDSKGKKDSDKLNKDISETIVSEKPNVHWDDVAGLH